ncbi:MAG: helix-turn-helix domain-containing protein [Pirellulales bacterium]
MKRSFESLPEQVPVLALRQKQAAKALGIGERKLWELTADQASGIPHVRLGKVILYPVDELRGWLAQQAEQTLKRVQR